MKNRTIDSILQKYKDFVSENVTIPEFMYQSERHLTTSETKAALISLFEEVVESARILDTPSSGQDGLVSLAKCLERIKLL